MFYSILFFAFQKKTSYLFVIGICVFHILKLTIRSDQEFLLLSASFQEALVPFRPLPFMLGSISLIGFLIYEFGVKHKLVVLGCFVALIILFYLFRIPSFGLVITYASGIAIAALKKDRIGGTYAIVGLALFGLFTRLEFMQNLGIAYYLGMIAFVVMITLLVGQRIKQTIVNQREAQLKSKTLENQLLKSTIQPHFITNSLTSLQELIDTNPAAANKFIENLAEEFRLFSEMAEQKLIPIEQELLLCKTHLEIMGQRKQGNYRLLTEHVEGSEMVPPGIFHTLIENGLTHGFKSKKDGIFSLVKASENGDIRFSLSNNGDIGLENESDGTGFKYIKNRLSENFGTNWSLEKDISNGQYQVMITLPK